MNIFASKQPYRLFYILFVVVLCEMMSMYAFPEALDIGRYYEKAENYAKIYTLSQYINFLFSDTFDFIYTSSLFIAVKIGLNLNFITIFYLSLYYISMCEIIRISYPTKIQGLVLLLILLAVPFVWIVSISRNTAGIAFFYFAILMYKKDNKILGSLFCIISIFTHISMILWILMAGFAFILQNFNINKVWIRTALVFAIICALLVPSYFIDIISIIAESSDSRYSSYANMGIGSPLLSSDIGYGDKLPMLFICMLSIYLIVVNNKGDFFYWMQFLLTTALIFAITSNMMMTNRIIMLLPLFLGCNICAILREKNQKFKTQIYILAILGLGCNFLHFWSYRQDLFT